MKNKKLILGFIIIVFLLLSYLFILIPISFIKDEDSANDKDLKPYGIRLTTFQNLNGSIIISWYTEKNASNPLVEYSLNEDLSNKEIAYASYFQINETYTYSTILYDLTPNSIYFYRVKSDKKNYRETLKFKSLPNPELQNFSFLLYGDSRTQREPRSELINKIMEFNSNKNFQFSIHSGDIVEDGRIQSQWYNYFNDTEDLYSEIPGLFVEGNHERGLATLMYDNLYPMISEYERYFSFVFGNCGFVILNSNDYYDINQEEEQVSWLNETLYSYSQQYEYNFVFLHHPLLHNRSALIHRQEWPSLFKKYNVTCVFCGHNHNYERSFPIVNQSTLDQNTFEYNDTEKYNYEHVFDPIYIVSGGAGAPLYKTYNYDFIAKTNSIYHFCVIDVERDVSGTNIKLEAWGMPKINDIYQDLQLLDNFTIRT